MSDDSTLDNSPDAETEDGANTSPEDALTALKRRADLMNMRYHPNISAEKLAAKIERKLAGDATPDDDEVTVVVDAPQKPVLTKMQRHNRLLAERKKAANKLVRIRVNCMNPTKSEWPGEFISAGSSKLGTFKKYIPFNQEEGYHVPYIIFQELKNRKCSSFYSVKGPRGNKIRKSRLINEFAVEVLPPLTQRELKELATQQAMAGSVEQ